MSHTRLLLLLCSLAGSTWSKAASTNPRLKLSFSELKARHGLRTQELEHSCCYDTLLLDEERGRLFVGGKNHLASLSLDNISKQDKKIYWPAPVEWREECNWAGKDINAECMNFIKILHLYNRTHLYACGTGAFHPTCAFVEVGQRMEDPVFKLDPAATEDGKGKSPYDPRHVAASVLVGEELYSGVATDLMGRDFTIFRSLGPRPSIRTEQHDSRWLNEPKFVDVFWIPESENPDDDKIYFFFRETAVERQQGLGKSSFARIGQICRNDMGGQRSLVNKWTTFLKARLVCSVPGSDGGDTYFDELRDVFLLQTKDKRNPLLYAVFSTSSSVFKGSAVCLYTMHDIRRAFLGPFAHKEGPNYQWVSYQSRVPYPRPGMCPSKTFGTFSSTKDFPDDVIQFARNHPLMYNPVLPHGQRPVFLQTDVDHTFTRIAVDRVTAADGHYDVLFIGTDVGTVLKVISVHKESWQNMEELLLEDLQVFKDSSPVTSMQISSKRQQLYLGSRTSISQLPLHRCGIYGKACAECCLARDPYCAWDGTTCTRYMPNTKRRFRRQDVRNGDPNMLCSEDPHRSSVLEKKLYGVEGSSTFLECVPKSLQAQVVWTYQKASDTLKKEGGSAGKGTALKNNSDADLVLFLNCFTSYQDQVEKRASVISTIENQLNRCRQSLAFNIDVEVSQPKGKSTPPRSLCITIQSKKRRESIEVDVLPAYNALGHVTPGCRPHPQVYVDLIQAGYGPSTFSTTFTELQKNFVKRRPAKLKNLLRLVKHWYKKYLLESYTLSVLPTKYALELLTIYAWERGTERAERFSTAEGFCTVMELLCRYQELCVYWTEFYDFQHPVVGAHIKQQLKNQRPVILDPADPTGLLGQGKKWELVAREASKCRSQLCFQNGTTPIQPWPVQPARPVQVRVKQLSGSWLDLTLSPSTTIRQIKGEIERLWHVPPYQQRLALQDTGLDNQKVLDDNGTLASHGIFYDVTILLLQTQPQEMEIFVKGHDGRTYTFGARPTDTVQNLKAKIQAKLKVPVDQQRLTHNSQELEDRHPLSYYHIENHSTIYLLLRLRGGCGSPRALSPSLATVL